MKMFVKVKRLSSCLIGLLLLVSQIILCPCISSANNKSPRYTPIVEAVQKTSPAVVNIGTEQIVHSRQNPFYRYSIDPFFDRFFGDFFESYPSREYKKQSLGSGVIIDPKGYILTNEHVILKASKITVGLADGREFEGQLIGSDPKSDLAVIKISDENSLPAIKMGKSDDLMIGETVIAIGNPFGLSHTVTTGVISAIDRSIKIDEDKIYQDFIQTDASINPGNSGGPLLNLEGELIGINTAIYQKAEGIGFAIPINIAKRIVKDLIAFGEVHTTWLGIFVQEMTPQLSSYFDLPPGKGVLISKVVPKSPADLIGLKPGDIILKLGGKPVNSKEEYEARLLSYAAKDKIELLIFRNGKENTFTPVGQELPLDSAEDFAHQWLGIEVDEITVAKKLFYNLTAGKGVLITRVEKRSAADEIGIEPGDVIRQVNNQVIDNIDDYRKAILMARQKESILLLVQRGQFGYYATLQP